MNFRSILTISLLIISIICNAQSSKLFTTDKELSSSLLNGIYQDKYGIIWISTEDGLNRYDGAKFTVYKHENNNPHSLTHNFVRVLFEDSHGNLLIGCYNGIQMYDPATDAFSCKAKREDGKDFVSNINCIIERKNGEIWLSGNELSKLIIKDGQLTVQQIKLSIPNNVTDYIMEDKKGNMWIVRNENSIYCITPSNKVINYPIQKRNVLITNLTEDSNGDIYAGTIGNGLFKLDINKRSFLPLSEKENEYLPVKSVYKSSPDELYIGTDGNGLKIYNIRTGRIIDSRFDNSYLDLKNSKIHSLLKDKSGNFWIAIYQKGVLMIPAQQNSFKYIGYKSVNKNIIGNYCVTSLCKDKDDVMWVGTDNDGIYGISPNGRQLAHFSKSTDKSSVSSIIIKLFEDSDNNLWFGSFRDGMGCVDKKSGKCKYIEDLKDNEGNRIHRVYDITEDNQKRLWIATMGSGLFYYDMKTKKTHKPNNLNTDSWICCMYYSAKTNKLYLGSYEGLIILSLDNNEYKSETILSNHIIYSICEDEKGNILACTSSGLASFNPKNHSLKKYTMQDGLPSDVIYSIQEDEHNNFWISTDAGISRLNHDSERFINYFVGDGLQGNEFSKNASFKDKNSNIWFGGVNGITYFNPNEITNPAKKWNVRITDFYLHNIPIRKGVKSGNHDIIDEPVFDAQDFHLSYKDNAFTVEFSTIEYNSPERISYQYSMNDNEWIELPTGIKRVSFNDLHPGSYNLKIRAKDYTMLSEYKEINIIISPAWYATTLAKVFYFLLMLGAIYFIIQQIKHRNKVKQQITEHIHAEEINEAKLQFFINISHEIRTPMSLIISPLNKLINNDDDPERQKSYNIISRNSRRILSLVNQLMDIRKIDKGQMTLRFQQTNIVEFISDICDNFQNQVSIKNIKLDFITSISNQMAWIDPNNFDKILINLLSNAFKFTPKDGKINIYLNTGNDIKTEAPLQNYIEIIVEDNGIGIDENEIHKIFERFYQIHNSHNTSNMGTGIGLHLTRSLVQLHYGTINVENNATTKGSRFIIRIPIGKEHLKTEEIDIDNVVESDIIKENGILIDNEYVEDEVKEQRKKTKYRVLIVEDDDEIRKYIHNELSDDYHVSECSNGKEALGIILKKAPNIVISDIMMPEMDGITLCRKIKQNITINHIPVILLTAKTTYEDNMEGLDVGADAYMTKPFNIDILRKTVKNIIKSREVLKNCFSGNQEQEIKKPIFEMQSTDNKLMDRIMNVINRNISNHGLNVEMIAQEVGISRVHLHRKLKELTNQSTRDLIRNVRLKHAAGLLVKTDYNISEISDMTGFSSLTIFCRSFKDLYGMTPTEYAEKTEKEEKRV